MLMTHGNGATQFCKEPILSIPSLEIVFAFAFVSVDDLFNFVVIDLTMLSLVNNCKIL